MQLGFNRHGYTDEQLGATPAGYAQWKARKTAGSSGRNDFAASDTSYDSYIGELGHTKKLAEDPAYKQAWADRPRKSSNVFDRIGEYGQDFLDISGDAVQGGIDTVKAAGPDALRLAALAVGGNYLANGSLTGAPNYAAGGGGQAALNGTLPGGNTVATNALSTVPGITGLDGLSGSGTPSVAPPYNGIPGIPNPGIPGLNIPGTEQSLWPAILGGVTQGLIADNAISDAAEISADAATYAADLQQGQYDQTRADLSPYMDAGTNALAQYTGYGRSRVNPDDYYGNVELDPGFQFRKNEMLTGTRNELAGFGEFMSGSRINAIMDRTGKMASDEYGRAYGRVDNEYRLARNEEDTYLNRLAGLVQGGHNAAAGVGNIGMQTANNIGNLTMDAANSQGALELGQSNILNNIIGDVTDTYYLRDNPYDPFRRYYS